MHTVKGVDSVSLCPMLGERLLASRRKAGMTQIDLAAACGDRYDYTVISAVEHGRSSMRLPALARAAEALSVSTDYLLDLTDDPTPAQVLTARVRELERQNAARSDRMQDAGAARAEAR